MDPTPKTDDLTIVLSRPVLWLCSCLLAVLGMAVGLWAAQLDKRLAAIERGLERLDGIPYRMNAIEEQVRDLRRKN